MTEDEAKTLKVGDKILCVQRDVDCAEGKEYIIERLSEKGTPLFTDDVGDEWIIDDINCSHFSIVKPSHLTPEQAKALKVGDEVVCIDNRHAPSEGFNIGEKYKVIEKIDDDPIIPWNRAYRRWILWGGFLVDFALPSTPARKAARKIVKWKVSDDVMFAEADDGTYWAFSTCYGNWAQVPQLPQP